MANTVFKRDEIILLLGAGASVEAGIPDSNNMVRSIESLVSGSDQSWSRFRDLYRYIRSAVFYADGLDGIFDENVPFNIERLVNVLDELQKRERHALYPFVGAWNPKLVDVAGSNFEHVLALRSTIVDALRNQWIVLPEQEKAEYYAGLLRFQQEYEYPLRVFSLNYDLCVEASCGQDNVQRGFANRTWDWRLFDETLDEPLPLMLYKLHGSLDWYFADDGTIRYSDSPSNIRDEEIALIFGTSYKLQYVDPFLFLAYELRRWTLDAARVIVCVGYGFSDEHINGILGQALRQDCERRLLAVTGPGDPCAAKDLIVTRLEVQEAQVLVRASKASEFLEKDLTIASLAKHFPIESDLILEVQESHSSSDLESEER